MVGGFAQQGFPVEALQLFKEMLSMGGLCPNEFLFGSVFSACSSLFQLEYGKQLHSLCIKFGLGQDVFAGCSLGNFYAKCGSIYSAKIAFCQIQNPDLVAWNAITAGFAYSGDVNEAHTGGFCKDRSQSECSYLEEVIITAKRPPKIITKHKWVIVWCSLALLQEITTRQARAAASA